VKTEYNSVKVKETEFHQYPCGINEWERRFDRVARKLFPGLPLAAVFRCIRNGSINVNGMKKAPSYRIGEKDVIFFEEGLKSDSILGDVSAVDGLDSVSSRWKELQILYEDEHIIAVCKPSGILVHGRHSLEARVKSYLKLQETSISSFQPGPLHRLDRNTSGVLFFGKTALGARRFSELQREKLIEKNYFAVLDGELKKGGTWEDSLIRDRNKNVTRVAAEGDGKKAKLVISPVFVHQGKTLAVITLLSGRTHQIRVQCSTRGFPLSGDKKYSGSFLKEGFILHAFTVHFLRKLHELPLNVSAPRNSWNVLLNQSLRLLRHPRSGLFLTGQGDRGLARFYEPFFPKCLSAGFF